MQNFRAYTDLASSAFLKPSIIIRLNVDNLTNSTPRLSVCLSIYLSIYLCSSLSLSHTHTHTHNYRPGRKVQLLLSFRSQWTLASSRLPKCPSSPRTPQLSGARYRGQATRSSDRLAVEPIDTSTMFFLMRVIKMHDDKHGKGK